MLRGWFRVPLVLAIPLFGALGLLALASRQVAAAPPLPPDLQNEAEWIEAEYQNILKGPIEGWKLKPVRERYQGLLKRVSDAKGQAWLQSRIDRIESQEEMARSAATLEGILERSRRRDREVEITRQNLAQVNQPQRKPFTARGLLQASSRLVDGHRVYALIGDEGRPIAYLDVPDGLDARPIVSKRVGVRGSVRYNEALGAKLIAVRDFETLQ